MDSKTTFSASNYWFWVPLVATHMGAIFGSTLYDVLIGWHLDSPVVPQ